MAFAPPPLSTHTHPPTSKLMKSLDNIQTIPKMLPLVSHINKAYFRVYYHKGDHGPVKHRALFHQFHFIYLAAVHQSNILIKVTAHTSGILSSDKNAWTFTAMVALN